MLSNYFTLLNISKLLHQRYTRTVVAQIYSQEKNTLSILLYTPEPHTITISCNTRENYIVARTGDFRSQKNTIDLFPGLIDKHIESVYMSATDRIVYIRFSENLWLCVEMFASKANVVLCDENGVVVDAFLNKKEVLSTTNEIQREEKEITVEVIVPEKVNFIVELCEHCNGQQNLLKSLKKTIPKLGTTLAEEIIFNSKVEHNTLLQEGAEIIFTASQMIIRRLCKIKRICPVVYFEEKSPICFSLMPLKHLSTHRNETYDDLFLGIQKFISFERSTSSFLEKKKEITSWLGKELKKAERTVQSLESELAESSRAEQYELYANLIMVSFPTISKGLKSVSLENSFSHNEVVIIPLEPSLTPQKNAEKYFEKAKKAKGAREEARNRLQMLKQRMTSVTGLIEKSNSVNDSFSLKNFIQSYGGIVKELGFMTEKEHEELPPFKIFAVEGGFTVFAGKNSVNNDLLTFRFAKPNDLWFHARGSSGSHVVLKIGSAQGTPTKKAIEQAASIAAYYSKMKNAKHVPVAMTERKYIHKPKGAPAGTVALDKEKVIFVHPVLPGKVL